MGVRIDTTVYKSCPACGVPMATQWRPLEFICTDERCRYGAFNPQNEDHRREKSNPSNDGVRIRRVIFEL